MTRLINIAGRNVICSFEGLLDGDPSTVNLDPYLCPADVWSIAWGHAIIDPVTNQLLRGAENRARAYALYPGGITRDQAVALLDQDLIEKAKGLDVLIKTEVTSNQFSALGSFAFNEGLGHVNSSTLLRLVNARQFAAAADQFPLWDKANGQVLNGLVRRRAAERQLFLTPDQ